MHKAFLSEIDPGRRLGKSLYSDRGDVLLARGAVLTDRVLAQLRNRGYHAVYLLDGTADDVEPTDIVSLQVRQSAVANLKQMYGLMKHTSRPLTNASTSTIREPGLLREVGVQLDAQVREMLLGLYRCAESILDEVVTAETLDGLSQLKRHDEYTFQHSVDVAVYGTMLGKRLGLLRAELRELAVGCLLHDIGKIHIDPRIIRKPGTLSSPEFEQMQHHALLGYEMVRQMPTDTPRPAHIVLQHHEWQDGSGYPRGLVGTNRVARTERERFDTRRILFLAEVASVADMYGALASDRSYRVAQAPERIISMLRADAGAHLNAEVVRTFLSIVQVYPIGLPIRIMGGSADGCTAVVTRSTAGAPNRPHVRLTSDRFGKPLDGPELDLRLLPDDVQLVSLHTVSTDQQTAA